MKPYIYTWDKSLWDALQPVFGKYFCVKWAGPIRKLRLEECLVAWVPLMRLGFRAICGHMRRKL